MASQPALTIDLQTGMQQGGKEKPKNQYKMHSKLCIGGKK